MIKVKITERGWAGHYILCHQCLFRRNTLIEYKDKKIVVSTVGAERQDDGTYKEIGPGRYFETMAFHTKDEDNRYYDIDVTKPVTFNSKWKIEKLDADDKANVMHDKVVKELSDKIRNKGDI